MRGSYANAGPGKLTANHGSVIELRELVLLPGSIFRAA